jgi:hypothetical protein
MSTPSPLLLLPDRARRGSSGPRVRCRRSLDPADSHGGAPPLDPGLAGATNAGSRAHQSRRR